MSGFARGDYGATDCEIMTPTSTSATTLVQSFITESACAAELFITAVPTAPATAPNHAVALCGAVNEALRAHDAWIVEERVFGTAGSLELLCAARSRSYGPRAGNVRPLRIDIARTPLSDFGGIQVHAVCKTPRPEEIKLEGTPIGRILRQQDSSLVTLSAISSLEAGPPHDQAYRCFEKAESLLKQLGADFFSVARTWWWLNDICGWYGEFNRARGEFFKERGLIGKEGSKHRLPASTGIGMRPADEAACALDVVAILAPQDRTRCFGGAGNQRSAYDYGSAFSRAARTNTPGGETVFVSGTAAIDAKGATCHVGNAAGQIADTMDNVCAVLSDMKCRNEDVVHAIAYCKTPEVEQVWNSVRGKYGWPFITVPADVCREELLFEVEATACPGVRHT